MHFDGNTLATKKSERQNKLCNRNKTPNFIANPKQNNLRYKMNLPREL